MHGPWYTFETAKEKLALNQEEFLYRIDTGSLEPVVYTKQRPFLLIKRDSMHLWIGFFTCLYRGHLSLHKNSIAKLLEDGEIRLGKGTAKLLELDKIQGLTNKYPFKQPAPFDQLQSWCAAVECNYTVKECTATPLPEEKVSHEAGMSKIMNGFNSFIEEKAGSKASSNQKQKQKIVEDPYLSKLADKAKARPAMLDFNKNSLFKLEDLRIPASEIKKFLGSKTNEPEEPQKVHSRQDKASSDERTHQLNELILRALRANPAVKSPKLWKLMQSDWETDNPEYDQESIILNMDAAGIDWRNHDYVEQSLKRSSFSPVVSKLRKRL